MSRRQQHADNAYQNPKLDTDQPLELAVHSLLKCLELPHHAVKFRIGRRAELLQILIDVRSLRVELRVEFRLQGGELRVLRLEPRTPNLEFRIQRHQAIFCGEEATVYAEKSHLDAGEALVRLYFKMAKSLPQFREGVPRRPSVVVQMWSNRALTRGKTGELDRPKTSTRQHDSQPR